MEITEGIDSRKADDLRRQQGNRYRIQKLELDLSTILRENGPLPISSYSVLEVGCGSGYWLRLLAKLGARLDQLHGIDISPERIRLAVSLSPEVSFSIGEAAKLPYADHSFDLALQFTLFTSILDDNKRKVAAAELVRVLRPGGTLLWYDFIWNPANRQTRGIRKQELQTLFPGCYFDIRRVTLAPPLARRVVSRFRWLCAFLERLPLFCSHYLAVIITSGDGTSKVE